MLFKRLLWLLPGLLVLILSLALHAPARWLASVTPTDLPVSAWGGSVMDGQAAASYRGRPLYVAWQLRWADLLRFKAGLELRLRGDITTDAVLRRSLLGGGQLELARVSISPEAGTWLLPGSQLPAWQGRDIVLARAGSGAWDEADGRMSSAGGPLRLILQGQEQSLTLPPSTLSWSLRDQDLVGELRQRDGSQALASVTLTASHRIQWQLRDRLLRLKTGYASQNDPDLVVLTVSEPLQ